MLPRTQRSELLGKIVEDLLSQYMSRERSFRAGQEGYRELLSAHIATFVVRYHGAEGCYVATKVVQEGVG